ncbi:MAG: DNA/RNA non-specific endonuclease, partial [Acidobacteria bacterium]|nr:DNA/RNA non-specific endonuclease [Acidobacteriota bacterium]
MVTALLFLAIQTLYAQPGRFGLPACDGPDQHLASRAAFTLCHSNTRRVPVWTAYQLTPEMLEAPSAPRQHFRPTPNSPHPLLRPNAVPQLPELNLSAWRKIENDIRKLASHSDSLIILTGTLFDCDNIQHIGPNQIAVPCATFKIAIALSGETKSA